MDGAKVIGNWKPKLREAHLLSRFERKLGELGYRTVGTITLRTPEDTARIGENENSIAFRWHHDNLMAYGPVAMWSNIQPTEVKLADGSALPAKDSDIILMDSPNIEHRGVYPVAEGRWFIRAVVRRKEH